MSKPRLVLIDGNSLLYRAFFALPALTDPQGNPTNAVYGFLLMLAKVFQDLKPTYLAVAFDKGRVTFRNELYADYKGNRPDAPDDLAPQFGLIREVLQTLGIAQYEKEGYEGDDLIGTLSKRYRGECDVAIITGDRDTLQLVDDATTVYLTKRGVTQLEAMTPETVLESTGVTTEQIVDWKALMGDTSDNIPGVAGIGPKTASKLLQQFPTLDEIFARLDEVSGKKLVERLTENKDIAYISRKLATIKTDVDISTDLSEMEPQGRVDEARTLFERLGFRSMLGKMQAAHIIAGDEGLFAQQTQEKPADMTVVTDAKPSVLKDADHVAVSVTTAGKIPHLALKELAALVDDTLYYWQDESATEALRILLGGEAQIITDRAKLLYQAAGIFTSVAELFDVTLAAYVLNPTRTSYPVTYLADAYHVPAPYPYEDGEKMLAARAQMFAQLVEPLTAELKANGAWDLYMTFEMPLTQVLAAMEHTGIAIDQNKLAALKGEFTAQAETLAAEIYELAGETFNILSPQQLSNVLFTKLELPPGRKTKTGYSTDAEVLNGLLKEHPIVAKVLTYRTITKLISTYLDGIAELVDPETERVHTTFNQTVTATGRLSSSDPNLQNIPVRTEEGRRIRSLFVPGKGFSGFMSADYSQIELRILAHLSEDEKLREAFLHQEDIHRRTAAEVLHKDPKDVTAAERSHAKAVNFGIIYGISDYGLARDLGISREEAGAYIEKYLERYPKVRQYMADSIAAAKESGRAETMYGRFRVLPDIHSRNFNRRSFAERTALNTPIQGAAADIIKRAMNNVYWALVRNRLKSRMLLQVHDELVLEVVEEERDIVTQILEMHMPGAAELAVPLVVDIHYGTNWEMAK